MSNVNFEKHYAAFKWAVSTNWKDKNGLHRSIQHKIETLVQEYDLSEREILDIDEENTRDDPDYQPEILFDPTNPEDLLIAKETLEFVYGHFNETEMAYLNGEMDLSEAAEKMGLGSDAFRKRLERRTKHFKNAITALEPNTP